VHMSINATITDAPDDTRKEMDRAHVALKKRIISIFNKIMYLVHQGQPDGASPPLLFLSLLPPPHPPRSWPWMEEAEIVG